MRKIKLTVNATYLCCSSLEFELDTNPIDCIDFKRPLALNIQDANYKTIFED